MVPRHPNYFVTVLIAASLCGVAADEQRMRFRSLGADVGLDQGMINDMVQDERGFIWIATNGGLYRHDGQQFLLFQHNGERTSIANGVITAIRVDGSGRLWLWFGNGGVDRFDPRSFAADHIEVPHADGAREPSRITAICTDGRDGLWAVADHRRILHCSGGESAFAVRYPNAALTFSEDEVILGLCRDSSGRLWVSTNRFPLRVANPDQTWREFGLPPGASRQFRGSMRVTLDIDRLDGIWLNAGSAGLYHLAAGETSLRRIALPFTAAGREGLSQVTAIAVEESGRTWLGTDGRGIVVLDAQLRPEEHFLHDQTDSRSINSNDIRSLFVDRTQSVWIGTRRGLCLFSRFANKFAYYPNKLSRGDEVNTQQVSSLAIDTSGNLWVGTASGAIARYAPDFGPPRVHDLGRFGRSAENPVTAICALRNGAVLAGVSGNGLFRYQPGQREFARVLSSPSISGILEDSKGNVWFTTTDSGLCHFDPATGAVGSWSLDFFMGRPDMPLDISSICEDRRGHLWLGSDSAGVLRISPDRSSFVRFTDGLSSVNITSLHADTRNRIWIGTRFGLTVYDADSQAFTHYFEVDGLPNNNIEAVIEDHRGTIWVSTEKGLACLDPESGRWECFDPRDGLQAFEFSPRAACSDHGSSLYFGGINGFNRINPDAIPRNTRVPKVQITNFATPEGRLPLNSKGTIELPYWINSFSVEYTLLDYAEPGKHTYASKLEGVENEWNQTGMRSTASYVQIPPGEYLFRARGANNDGTWSTDDAVLHISIAHPIWQTFPFQFMLFIAITFTAFAMFRARVNAIRNQRIALEKEVIERSIAEMKLLNNQTRLRSLAAKLTLLEEGERRRIAQALHDKIGHALSLAKLNLVTCRKNEMIDRDNKLLLVALERITTAIDDTRSLTTEISPPALYKFGLIAAAEDLTERLGKQHGFLTVFEAAVDDIILPENVAILIYQAIRELLVNAIKHAQATNVRVAIHGAADMIQVVVADNGVGFDVDAVMQDESKLTSFGLFSIRERLESIGGTLEIESARGKGTIVELSFSATHGE